MMNNIYMLMPDNRYGLVIPKNADAGIDVASGLHRDRLLSRWQSINMETIGDGNECARSGELAICSFGGLLIRERFVDSVMHEENYNVELLPIIVDGQPWRLVNCLNHADSYDKQRSSVWLDVSEKIYMINNIFIIDPKAGQFDVFTIGPSNRSSILVSERFRERILRLNLDGITFRLAGSVG